MKILTVQFDSSSKNYDYLLDSSEIPIKVGTILKKVRGFSGKFGPIYTRITVKNIQEVSAEAFPAHVTAFLCVDKDAVIKNYVISKAYFENKAKAEQKPEENGLKEIKHLAYLYASSAIYGSLELSTTYYVEGNVFQDKVEKLKGYQDSLLDTIIEVYNRNDKHIRLDKRACAVDFFIEKILSTKDIKTITEKKAIIINMLVEGVSHKDNTFWEEEIW